MLLTDDVAVIVMMMVFNVVVLIGSGVEPTDTVREGVGENWTSICIKALK